jgi:ribosomal protein S18 acetylase RimI-like enzyme
MNEQPTLLLKLVRNNDEVETLRVIRNTCRNFMTRQTYEISADLQQVWWQRLDKSVNFPYLFFKLQHGVIVDPIGYGYVRFENGEVLLTGGLIPEERGQGYGKTLFGLMINSSMRYNAPIKLEVLNTNTNAFEMYKSLGFEVISSDDKITKMEYFYDSVI